MVDVDRAKVFYVDRLGFTDEQDHRFDQTPPLRGAGAACSRARTRPWPATWTPSPVCRSGVQLNVEDVDAVQGFLPAHGVEVSDVSSTRGGAAALSSTRQQRLVDPRAAGLRGRSDQPRATSHQPRPSQLADAMRDVEVTRMT